MYNIVPRVADADADVGATKKPLENQFVRANKVCTDFNLMQL